MTINFVKWMYSKITKSKQELSDEGAQKVIDDYNGCGTHLRFDLMSGPDKHAQEVMKDLGITYQHATPQSLGDQWWFWNCENIPEKLPQYLRVADFKPYECIGYGLSEMDAVKISSYEPKKDESKI